VTHCDLSDTFSSLDGLRINHKEGEIQFLLFPCQTKTPDCFRVFTMSDLTGMIQTAAIFSLDPPDNDMIYHPFNAMRFMPPQLHGSRFLETLLSTDYLLKFLTIGQEVRSEPPFFFNHSII
jgi:hypothetical protein